MWAYDPQLIFQVETVLPIWTKDFALPYKSAHASVIPQDEQSPARQKDAWPVQAPQHCQAVT